MSGRTVVVTGAAGFLGSHVVERLSAAGRFEVIATDVVASARADALAKLPGVRFQAADLRDTETIETLVQGAESLVHLAAVRGQASVARPRDSHDVNVGATFDLVTLAARHHLRRIVYGSSHLTYGAFADPHHAPFTEDQAAVGRGLTLYSASKLASEALMAALCGDAGPDYVALRFGTIYGPRVNLDSTNGLLVAVLAALDRGEKAPVPWTRDTVHAMTYVVDAAAAVVSALDVEQDVRGAVNTVGPPVTAERLYSTLVTLYGGDPRDLDWRDERARYQFVSAERLRTVLGIETLTSLEDGLSAVIDWYRTELRAASSSVGADARTTP
jgi:nucleoside-diphosphate-sugar epimerase